MAEREKDNRIEALYAEGRRVYSFSRLNTIDDCMYAAWQSYHENRRGLHNIYDLAGSKMHDALESIIKKTAGVEILRPALQAELDEADSLGIDFPLDFRGGTTIRDKWIANMEHFCETFVPPRGNFETELLMIYRIDDTRALIGYADLIRHNADGTISIFDWKTSSNFQTKDLIHHGRQFVVYTLAAEQMGYKVRDAAWIMLKYVEIKYKKTLKNGKISEKSIICDRCKIGEKICGLVETMMENAGYDSVDIEIACNTLMRTNKTDFLPDEIRSRFTIIPYVRRYDVTDELKAECLDFINKNADKYEAAWEWSKQPENQGKPWAPTEINKSNEFKCFNLCGHRRVCPALHDYKLLRQLNETSDDDLF